MFFKNFRNKNKNFMKICLKYFPKINWNKNWTTCTSDCKALFVYFHNFLFLSLLALLIFYADCVFNWPTLLLVGRKSERYWGQDERKFYLSPSALWTCCVSAVSGLKVAKKVVALFFDYSTTTTTQRIESFWGVIGVKWAVKLIFYWLMFFFINLSFCFIIIIWIILSSTSEHF